MVIPVVILLLGRIVGPMIMKMNSPIKLSVIIPTLDEERYIEVCLKSLKSQKTNFNYEIIIVDSSKNNKTIEIAKRYADKIFKLNKRGIALARNYGAKFASGKILVFTDADCVAPEFWLQEVAKCFEEKDTVASYGPVFYEKRASLKIKSLNTINSVKRWSSIFNSHFPVGNNMAIRKDVFGKINGFNKNLETREDVEIFKRIKKCGKIKFNKKACILTNPRRIENENFLKFLFTYQLGSIIYKIFGTSRAYRPYR
ncbi:MAG: glycosyltransferase [Candidatus Heimdallarchaeaceae archaeon]